MVRDVSPAVIAKLTVLSQIETRLEAHALHRLLSMRGRDLKTIIKAFPRLSIQHVKATIGTFIMTDSVWSSFYATKLLRQGLKVTATTGLLVAFGIQISIAAPLCPDLFRTPVNGLFFGQDRRPSELDNQSLRLLVWNIHKGASKNLPGDFENISFASDIVLLQESVSHQTFTEALSNANRTLGWTQAKSFRRADGDYTGVATGSRATPVAEEVLLSEVREPISHTPKTILISKFNIKGQTDQLLVANIHAINFVTNSSFNKHIQQLILRIKNHSGPIIIGGDFNTWNSGRMNYLNNALADLDLARVEIPHKGLLNLDHVYTRGLTRRMAFNLSYIRSSDHAPLLVDLVFEKNPVKP